MITVLLASFNGAKYIRQQLDSVLNQDTEEAYRILVSDDGSTDGTLEILEEYGEKYPEKMRLLGCGHGERTDGRVPAAAGNFFRLLAEAEGDYLLFCDQDDVWLPEKMGTLLGHMRELEARYGKEKPLLVYSDMKVTDENLEILGDSFVRYQNCDPSRTAFSQVLVENPVTGGAAMLNKSLAGLLKERPRACVMHDWWAALAASCFGQIGWVDEPLYLYRQHGSNTLGAKKSGNIGELAGRAKRGREVAENYRRIFAQAAAFGKMYAERMEPEQRRTLRAFLSLPSRGPAGRLRLIWKYGFTKSSRLQTLAQCLTIPRKKERRDEN